MPPSENLERDISQIMAGGDPGADEPDPGVDEEQQATDTSAATTKKKPASSWDLKSIAKALGISVAALAAVAVLFYFLNRWADNDSNNAKKTREFIDAQRPQTVKKIHDRVIAQVRAYRILGRLADVMAKNDPGKTDDLGSLMHLNLNERDATTPDPGDPLHFAEGVAVYIESVARSEKIEDELFQMIFEDASDEAIDKAFAERIQKALGKDEFARVVESLVASLLTDLKPDSATLPPLVATDPENLRNLSAAEFLRRKCELTAKAVAAVDPFKLLTEAKKEDLSPELYQGGPTTMATSLGITGERPFEGLGKALKSDPHPTLDKPSPLARLFR